MSGPVDLSMVNFANNVSFFDGLMPARIEDAVHGIQGSLYRSGKRSEALLASKQTEYFEEYRGYMRTSNFRTAAGAANNAVNINVAPVVFGRGRVITLIVALVVFLSGCGGSKKPVPPPGQSFTNTVFVGDSLTAGFQNGSLLDTQQPNGWAALVAKQANFSIQLPLIAPPGAPAVLQLKSFGPPPVVTQASGITTGRDDVTVQATDLAVPGHTVNDALNTAPLPVPITGQETITTLVLGYPGIKNLQLLSQAQWAKQLKPTTLFVWIGNNDALTAVNAGGPAAMTPVATFTTQFTQLLQYLKTNTTARLIVANIPDVTGAASLTPGAMVLAEFSASTGIPATQLSVTLGIDPTDLVTPKGLAQIPAILNGTAPGPIDPANKLTTAQVATVQQTVTQYNLAIATEVAAVGGTLVDMSAALNALRTTPPVINGRAIGFGFLGGFFSLDGIHPTNTGYAIISNAFIDAMNSSLKTSIPDVSLSTVAASDPLWPPNIKLSLLPIHISPQAGAATDWMTLK